METFSKILGGVAVAGAILGTLAFFALSPFVKTTIMQNFGGVSATSTTFSTGKVAEVNLGQILGATATSSAILNTDATDRVISDVFSYCTGLGSSNTPGTGAGLAALLLRVATSTTSGDLTNTNYGAVLTISTSSSIAQYSATSTTSNIPAKTFNVVWPTNTYLNFQYNATNTGACTAGAVYRAT